jgi:hypothetical protein
MTSNIELNQAIDRVLMQFLQQYTAGRVDQNTLNQLAMAVRMQSGNIANQLLSTYAGSSYIPQEAINNVCSSVVTQILQAAANRVNTYSQPNQYPNTNQYPINNQAQCVQSNQYPSLNSNGYVQPNQYPPLNRNNQTNPFPNGNPVYQANQPVVNTDPFGNNQPTNPFNDDAPAVSNATQTVQYQSPQPIAKPITKPIIKDYPENQKGVENMQHKLTATTPKSKVLTDILQLDNFYIESPALSYETNDGPVSVISMADLGAFQTKENFIRHIASIIPSNDELNTSKWIIRYDWLKSHLISIPFDRFTENYNRVVKGFEAGSDMYATFLESDSDFIEAMEPIILNKLNETFKFYTVKPDDLKPATADNLSDIAEYESAAAAMGIDAKVLLRAIVGAFEDVFNDGSIIDPSTTDGIASYIASDDIAYIYGDSKVKYLRNIMAQENESGIKQLMESAVKDKEKYTLFNVYNTSYLTNLYGYDFIGRIKQDDYIIDTDTSMNGKEALGAIMGNYIITEDHGAGTLYFIKDAKIIGNTDICVISPSKIYLKR